MISVSLMGMFVVEGLESDHLRRHPLPGFFQLDLDHDILGDVLKIVA